MPTIRETIESRWPLAADPQLHAGFWIQMKSALSAADDIRDAAAKIAKNPKLSAIGRLDEVRKSLANGLGGRLHKLRRANEVATATIAARKARLAREVTIFDKTDVVGATLRGELRTMLRSMTNGQRQAALLDADADAQMLTAVLEAPNVLSGVNDQLRAQVLDTVIRRRFPTEVKALEVAEDAAAIAKVATTVALNTARTAGEFPNETVLHDFLDTAVAGKREAIDRTVEAEFSSIAQPVAS